MVSNHRDELDIALCGLSKPRDSDVEDTPLVQGSIFLCLHTLFLPDQESSLSTNGIQWCKAPIGSHAQHGGHGGGIGLKSTCPD